MLTINLYVLCTVLIVAAYFDITRKKIPNFLTFPVIVWGVLSYIVSGGVSGFIISILGLLTGTLIFLIPFALGGMGAGDVKLMGAIGALAGAEFVLTTALIAALVGGLMAIAGLAKKKQLLQGLLNVLMMLAGSFVSFLIYRFKIPQLQIWLDSFLKESEKAENPVYLPYGVAIALGAVIAMTGIFPYTFEW